MTKTSSNLSCRPVWQLTFLELLPKIRASVLQAIRHLPREHRDEALQEAIAQAFLGFVILMNRERPEFVYPTVLARYALCRVRDGRTLGSRKNSWDVLSRVAQRRRGFTVGNLSRGAADRGGWGEAVVEDRRTPVPDQVSFRIDFPEWLARLSARNRRIAESLACGHSTQTVARKFRLSPGRISQLRREFQESWEQFHAGLAATTPLTSDGPQD
jgi:hypothetical protein